eukprot:SAG22_NODE_4681_length_1193_cov_1.047532_1_plen_78_part_10
MGLARETCGPRAALLAVELLALAAWPRTVDGVEPAAETAAAVVTVTLQFKNDNVEDEVAVVFPPGIAHLVRALALKSP